MARERPLPQADRLLRGGARPGGGQRARRSASLCAASTPRPRRRGDGRRWPSASSTPWPTTSTPRRPAPCSSSGWARPIAASRPASGVGVGASARDAVRVRARAARGPGGRGGPRGGSGAGRRREAARAAARLRRGGPAARRAGGARLGGPRHRGRRPASCAARSDRLRPQPGPGGAPGPAHGGAGLGHRARRERVLARRRGGARGGPRRRSRGSAGLRSTRGSAPRPGPTATRTPTPCSSRADALVLCSRRGAGPAQPRRRLPGGGGRGLHRAW